MLRIAGPLLGFALAAANTSANAQAGATPANTESAPSSTASEFHEQSPNRPQSMTFDAHYNSRGRRMPFQSSS
jgi:hypothetical protein